MQALAAIARHWSGRRLVADPASRALVVLALLLGIGPAGEILDATVFAEFEADLLFFDGGIDLIATALLPLCYLLLVLLVAGLAARGLAAFACGGAAHGRWPLPCRPGPAAKIPIL